MTRVLVTGGQGIVGRHAVAALLARGVDVHVIGRSEGRPSLLPDAVQWHRLNLLSEDPRPLIERVKPDALLHLAWVTEHGKFWWAPENLDWVAASLRLLKAFAEAGGKRVVMAGSCAEYDWLHLGDGICNANTPLGSPFLYGAAKDALRQTAASYCRHAGMAFTWGRIFLLYGDGEPPSRFVPSVIRALKEGGTARVSHGKQVRDLMSTHDCGRAFAELLMSPVEGALNVASGEGIALAEVVQCIHTLIGKGDVAYGAVPAPENDPPVLVADVTRLRQEVGFMPSDTLAHGLKRLIASTA